VGVQIPPPTLNYQRKRREASARPGPFAWGLSAHSSASEAPGDRFCRIRLPFRADVLVDRLSDGRGGVAEQPYHVQDVDARLKSGRRVRVAQPVGVMRGKPAASASLATDRITVAGFSGSPISSVKTNPARTTSDQRPAVLPRAVGDAPSGRRLLGDRGGGRRERSVFGSFVTFTLPYSTSVWRAVRRLAD
jgi:hypothetical protein